MAAEQKEPKEEMSLSELKEAFQRLHNSPAWGRLMMAIQGQVDTLQREILFTELTCEGDVLRMERRKGMLEGRLSLVNTAGGMLDAIEQDLRAKTGGDDDVDS